MLRSGGIYMVVVIVTLMVLQASSALEKFTPLTRSSSTTKFTPLIPSSSTTKCNYKVSCSQECHKLFDSYGCPYCHCPLTCETVDCLDGYVCEMQELQCFVPPCPKYPKCVPIGTSTRAPCPQVMCAIGCERIKGPDGCPKCVCPKTCKDVKCEKDEICYLKTIICVAAPCFPVPTCAPKYD